MVRFHQIEKDVFRGESIMLSNSTSNSSFLNADGHETDDRIQILDCEDTRRTYHEPMSQTRRICFIASIVGTFLVIVVFMLLPCESNCVAKTGLLKTRNWLKNYEKMEMKGEINLVQPPTQDPRNLVFMYRSDKIFPDVSLLKNRKVKNNGGIVTLSGASGDVKWTREMQNEPRSIDCNLIDCDNSGTKDCLILDELGQLSCLDVDGRFIFYVNNPKAAKQSRKDLLDFPLILPDLDGDSVNEIMMSSPNGKSNSTDLIIVSGATGRLKMMETQNCSFVHKLQIDTDYAIKYICIKRENTEQQMIKNLTDFYSQISKKPLNTKRLQAVSRIPQHKYYGQRTTTLVQETVTEVQDKKLTVANSGSWPRDSKAVITLTQQHPKGVTTTLYNQTFNRVYVMVPVPLALNSTSSVDNIHGFVIKMWIWNGTEVNYNLEKSRLKRSNDKRDLKAQRSNYTNQNVTSSGYKTRIFYLKESIMLIVFNSTDMKTENTSQSNIVQFCQKTVGQKEKKSDSDSVCQPDLSYQENSVLITDIDGDGSKELVSYYSTFVNENLSGAVIGDKWKLKTYIQLFKLETELPKLYADLNMV